MKVKNFLQQLGKSMLLPIVAMPVAGILIRLTAADMLNVPIFQAAGVVLGNMDAILAVAIAIGLSKTKDRGIPALTGFIAILVLKEGLKIANPELNMSVFGGLLSGILASVIYNKFKDTKLPDSFAFFGGEKFPITMIIITMIPVAYLSSLVWPYAQAGIDSFSRTLMNLGALGIFIFGFLNRFLLPFGLHHVINTYVYFGLGQYTNTNGEVISGEITRFMAGDPTARVFIGGFFITMMFGIPAIALAITKASNQNKKKEVKALMTSGSITSFFTGITEPIEFTFLFASPLLYFVHSIYTGLAGAVLYLLGIRHGFSWGAGVIDFVLNLKLSDKGFLIIPVGLIFFSLYYFTFSILIKKKNIKLLGREDEINFKDNIVEEENLNLSHSNYEYMAKKILENIGGKDNLNSYENCMTRLRLEVKDISLIDENKIKQTGAHGIIKIDNNNVQIVIGPKVANVMREFKKFVE